MPLKFAILRNVDRKGSTEVVLECDQDVLKERLSILTLAKLSAQKKPFRGYSKDQIAQAVKDSFSAVAEEFKQESIRIK